MASTRCFSRHFGADDIRNESRLDVTAFQTPYRITRRLFQTDTRSCRTLHRLTQYQTKEVPPHTTDKNSKESRYYLGTHEQELCPAVATRIAFTFLRRS